MTEREHAHAGTLSTPITRDEELAPGRASLSAKLDGPTHPLISGLIQRKAERDSNGVADGAEHAVATATSSSGMSLPTPIMRKFESSLGTDLSSVRVHTGAESATAASAVGAKAYTAGQDIHFGAGQFDPSSGSGQHLLAHEVAHTVQQRGGTPTRQNKLEVSGPADAAEHEADHAANAMVSGGAAKISGFSPTVARIATAYSDDKDLKELPAPPKYVAADGSFAAMAASLASSMQGNGGSLVAPQTGLAASNQNLIACRENAESANVFYSTHLPSKWNPFASGNLNGVYAQNAQADAAWAISMLADVRVAGDATSSWISLANTSNTSWADLVKRAQAMSIEVTQKQDPNNLAGLADGQKHTKPGDQTINATELSGSGNQLGTMARQMGIKAPDTGAYKTAMTDYTQARNEIAPQQYSIITQLIPTAIDSIKAKQSKATEEKDKWETIAQATEIFEKGLTVAFSGAEFVEGETGAIGTQEVKDPSAKEGEDGLIHSKTDVAGATEKAGGVLASVIDIRIKAIQAQITAYNSNLKTYAAEEEAAQLKAHVLAYQNGLVNLRTKAKRVEDEQAKMAQAFSEFGTSIDKAMVKQGKAPAGSTEASQASGLFSAVRSASVATQGALDGLTSGGAADLPGLYGQLAVQANSRNADQTGGDGRSDPRSAVFAIEGGRWSTAATSINGAREQLYRRNAQIQSLETKFMQQFAGASQGTDSIK